MDNKSLKILLIADSNVENLAALMNNDFEAPALTARCAPFDQVAQILMNADQECWRFKPDYALVWSQPAKVSQTFGRLQNFESIDVEEIFNEIDGFATLLLRTAERVKGVFVPSLTVPPSHHAMGMIDYVEKIGIRNTLERMNERLATKLAVAKNIYFLDCAKWISRIGSKAYNPKLWYMAKILFSNEVFSEALHDIKSAINGIEGKAKKLIVVDLDETLWGGIVGDVGWKQLRLGGHDPVGEAFKDFQKALKSLTNRGILLGIVSKNDESVAMQAIDNHPEMVLRAEDFAGWKINWNDKAINLADLVSELNLGIESVVFIDDNPVERARIHESFPEVFVPEMPEDSLLFPSILNGLRCFDSPVVSEEDKKRTVQYRTEQKRKSSLKKVESIDEWLKSLETVVTVEPLRDVNLERTVQLFNKTNQMNLTTRRMTAEELTSWTKDEDHELLTIRVKDKFGDLGLVGIVSLEFTEQLAVIADFVLSCRAMGRKIEETMVHLALERARSKKTSELIAVINYTERNKPCQEFWEKSGFKVNEESKSFSWQTNKQYDLPESVTLELK